MTPRSLRSLRLSRRCEEIVKVRLPDERWQSTAASRDNTRLFAAQHLTKRYGRLTALSGVSFSVRAGEVLGLIGPNGSGKTTLFECLGGVLPLDEGSLVRDGQPMSERARASTLFYLPDAIVPWPSQRVRWAIDFMLGLFRGRADLVDDVIGRLDIVPLLDATIGSLSKGQRKRALLAIGLLTPHPVLLADEPFDGLDPPSRDVLGDLLSEAAASGAAVIVSTHRLDIAERASRCIALFDGKVTHDGPADEATMQKLLP
jgi:ABC-2 type transport system ATP-binding protein